MFANSRMPVPSEYPLLDLDRPDSRWGYRWEVNCARVWNFRSLPAREVQTKSFKSLKRDRGEEVQQHSSRLLFEDFRCPQHVGEREREREEKTEGEKVEKCKRSWGDALRKRHLRNFLRFDFRGSCKKRRRFAGNILIHSALDNEASRFFLRLRSWSWAIWRVCAHSTANWVIEKASGS